MDDARTLLRQENVISLRTAFVRDNGNLVSFSLMPADIESLLPKRHGKRPMKDFEWVSRDRTWLYRHLRSASGEKQLMDRFPCLEHNLKPMFFEGTPTFKLLWTDSGKSVALVLNDEPWAFICEETNRGYSKGILKPEVGNPWNQQLFEKIFRE